MSKRKRTYVSVEDSEWRRVRSQAEQLRAVQNNLPELLEGVRRQSQRDMQRQFEPLEQRQRAYEQALAQANAQIRKVEVDTARRLAVQQRQMRTELQDMAGQLRQETRTLLQQQETKLTGMIEQERAERQRQAQVLQDQITKIVTDQTRQGDVARSLIQTARIQANFIRDNYRHQQFRPGRLEQLESAIQSAEQSLQPGINAPQAAIATAQTACRELGDLRLELEYLEAEWRTWRVTALESARALFETAQRNRKVQAVGLEGEPIEADVAGEVDHWTSGKLSDLETRVQGVIQRVADDDNPMSTADLRKVAETQAPELHAELDRIIEEAQLAVLGSQVRISLADEVVLAMEERGFAVEDATYEGEDQREGFVAKVGDLGGNEVVIHVTPVEGDPKRNQLSISSYPDRPEPELRQQAKEIADTLRAHGISVPERMEESNQFDPIGRDPGAWRRLKPRAQAAQPGT